MALGNAIGTAARHVDRRFGVRAWLRGEPRPPAGGFDLDGEKLLDWGWICANLPRGRKKALEIGCGESPVIPTMLAMGYEVVGVDLGDRLTHLVAGFTHVRGDFNQLDLDSDFDVVVACSAIEHFGLSGRYGSGEDPSADLKASKKILRHLAPAGLLFLTIPVGRDVVHRPWHRVYGRERLPQILYGFEIVSQRFLTKEPWGPWREVNTDVALEYPIEIARYALGEFVLRKPVGPQ
jgi:SAM-dependent methyltransferase